MTIPTAIAPTVELATPKVYKYVTKITEHLAPAKLVEFSPCCPSTYSVEDHHDNHWTEGMWGAIIETGCFTLQVLDDLRQLSTTIHIDGVDITARDDQVILEFALSARVLRH